MLKFFAVIGVLTVFGFAALFFIGIGAVSNGSHTNSTTVLAPNPNPSSYEPAIATDPIAYYTAYHRNEVAADAQFKGKAIQMVAIVGSIKKDAFGETYLTLPATSDFEEVQAKLQTSEVAQAGRLLRGDQVTLLCHGGTMIIGTPMLEDCTFTQTPSALRPQAAQPSPSTAYQSAGDMRTTSDASDQAPEYGEPSDVSATPLAPVSNVAPSQMSEDDYEDKYLSTMQTHWIIPQGIPVGAKAGLRITLAPNGSLITAIVNEGSTYPALDQSCVDALRQIGQFDATPTGRQVVIEFDCRVK
jgi:tRNA_anti-like/TonB C terminal